MTEKKRLREEINKRLEAHSAAERRAKSLLIQKKLFGLEAFRNSSCVCFYVSLPTEVDTVSMIDQALETGKRVVVPLSDLENKELKLFQITNPRTDLKKGAYGIFEPDPRSATPVDPGEVDCVVVPGIVFDEKKNRIGRGHGFYDRFLNKFGPKVFKVGLAFSFQVIPQVPQESHDEPLDLVLTE